MPEIQYVSDESGNATAVIVPIELWREIDLKRKPLIYSRART
jgi:hypothetical protein